MKLKPGLRGLLIAAVGVSALAPPAIAAGASKAPKNNAYIVQLAEQPVATYTGGIAGYTATKPSKGKKIDPNHPQVVSYMGYLQQRQDSVLNGVGGGKKLYNYGYVFNGFAAELTEAQAQRVAQMPGVLAVSKDEARPLDTSSTPSFLGLTGPTGVWATKAKGEGVIIGIVDGGIWPESLSFSDRTGSNGNASKDGKLDYQQIPGWNGKCTPGEAFNASHCNQKLIGARYYNAGFGGNAGIDTNQPWEYNSPRDFGGHGTHVASTAGGNANVPTTGDAAALGAISGIAPRARIAAYKGCWETGAGGSCFNTDSVAAIDQAVADGVDVINFSVSGSRTSFRDPVEIAFLFAADAGIFVATSAGNSGPGSSTVAHPGPWVTTVANGTHNRNGVGSITLGNGANYSGASMANALASSPMIDSTAAGLAGANPQFVELCYGAADNGGTPVLDPAKVAGKIVLCKRGTTALVNKTAAVKAAGGAGAVIYNDPAPGAATTTLALLHTVPAVHVLAASGLAIKTYLAGTATPTGAIAQSTIVFDAAAPFTNSSSSRGPLLAGNGDVLKPDLMAPGTDILAAVAPPGNSGRDFDLYSGTSMSSPHVAGLAALFKERYPSWSPMAIKSALMTTAYDILDGGTPAPNTNPVLIFRQGAGHVNPPRAFSPGLVYDSSFSDWLAFICGAQPGGGCTGVTPIDPSNLNQASIAIGDMAGVQTVTRKVKNVSGGPLTVAASVTGMVGFTTTVTPSGMTLAPGAEGSFSVNFLRTTAALNTYTGGQLTWAGGGQSVRSPIVVRPVALAAPAQVSATYPVTFGYTGAFTATARGLVAAATTSGAVADDPTDGDCSLTAPNAQLIPVVVPAGTTYARFALFDADVNPGTDIDLCVFNGSTQVGGSGSGTSAEEVNLLNPTAATYTVVVHGWGVVGTSPFKLHTWLLGSADAGNMSVSAPASATTGTTGNITLGFSGLAAGTRYLGSVAYGGASGLPNPTIVRVDP